MYLNHIYLKSSPLYYSPPNHSIHPLPSFKFSPFLITHSFTLCWTVDGSCWIHHVHVLQVLISVVISCVQQPCTCRGENFTAFLLTLQLLHYYIVSSSTMFLEPSWSKREEGLTKVPFRTQHPILTCSQHFLAVISLCIKHCPLQEEN